MKLDDQFEWDLDSADASPEQFADVYTKELGLAGEFKYAVSSDLMRLYDSRTLQDCYRPFYT